MSLFQCEGCGCCENTATCNYWFRNDSESACKGRKLCASCDADIGKWHDEFDRTFLPMGKFKTNQLGNLEHIETGSEDFMAYEIEALP